MACVQLIPGSRLDGSQGVDMGRIASPVLRIVFLGALFGYAPVAPGQERVASSDINRYRPYFIKQSDADLKKGSIKVTFLGTNTLLFDDGESQVMIDGFFSRPSVVKLIKKVETDTRVVDAALKQAKVDRLKALFVSHSHYDHVFDAAY